MIDKIIAALRALGRALQEVPSTASLEYEIIRQDQQLDRAIRACERAASEADKWDRIVEQITAGPVDRCQRPPKGWICTRVDGHIGPCAALRVEAAK